MEGVRLKKSGTFSQGTMEQSWQKMMKTRGNKVGVDREQGWISELFRRQNGWDLLIDWFVITRITLAQGRIWGYKSSLLKSKGCCEVTLYSKNQEIIEIRAPSECYHFGQHRWIYMDMHKKAWTGFLKECGVTSISGYSEGLEGGPPRDKGKGELAMFV